MRWKGKRLLDGDTDTTVYVEYCHLTSWRVVAWDIETNRRHELACGLQTEAEAKALAEIIMETTV